MSTVTLKRHDTNLKFTDTLLVNGAPADLTGATVSFILRNQATAVAVKRTATVADAASGQVEYTPVAEDVATEGTFDAEWEVVWPGGKELSFPRRGTDRVVIDPDLA
jgi:hypothetical protein